MYSSSSVGASRLLDRLRERIRYRHHSLRTEQAYLLWVRAFVRFHELRHPLQMGGVEVEAFLNHLVNQRHVSASTHKQALSALRFLYRAVLEQELPWMHQIQRLAGTWRIPARTVASPLDALRGIPEPA